MGFVFDIFPVFFFAMFALVFGMILSSLLKGFRQNQKNNQAPRVTAEASVVTKRTKVWGDHAHTVYYATFQFPSGDRLELEIPHSQFGYLVEGDRGSLTFQGTRFLEFQRT